MSDVHWWARYELGRFVHAALVDKVPRDHRESDGAFRRRRIIVGVTLVVGATLLGISLRIEPGNNSFYLLTLALAATWVIGAFASGPIHLGWAHTRGLTRQARPIVQPVALALLLVVIFTLGAVVTAQIPPLRMQILEVLDYASAGYLPLVAVITLVNGLAEEVFFRGALFAALEKNQVLWSTAFYGLATTATLNPMLIFAALFLGFIVGLQRRVTGGVLGPMLIHIVWSQSMLFVLPLLIN